MICNNSIRYGLLHAFLHWSMAAIVFFLFGSGLYMVTLGYYDAGYNVWPYWHKSFGITLLILLVLRIVSLIAQQKPRPLASHSRVEIGIAHAAHGLMYILLATLVITGYLIATARGSQINVFGWFELPPLFNADQYAVLLGNIHLYAAWGLITIVALHIIGTLKHIIIDRDGTLQRMTGIGKNVNN